MKPATRTLVWLALSLLAATSRADLTTEAATTASPVRFSVVLDPRFAKEPLRLTRIAYSHAPRFIATVTNTSTRAISVTRAQTSITVRSLETNGRALVASSAPEANDHMVAYGAQQDSWLVELAPGQSTTIEFSGVDDRLELTDGHSPRGIRFGMTQPGKYDVSFEYRYHRPATGGRPERGFIGAARSNSVTFEVVR